ncbi:hypothetical protein MRB53_038620 [Persea americana]|nr:hypothetical protein MRB53_038620 [Persea americana]
MSVKIPFFSGRWCHVLPSSGNSVPLSHGNTPVAPLTQEEECPRLERWLYVYATLSFKGFNNTTNKVSRLQEQTFTMDTRGHTDPSRTFSRLGSTNAFPADTHIKTSSLDTEILSSKCIDLCTQYQDPTCQVLLCNKRPGRQSPPPRGVSRSPVGKGVARFPAVPWRSLHPTIRKAANDSRMVQKKDEAQNSRRTSPPDQTSVICPHRRHHHHGMGLMKRLHLADGFLRSQTATRDSFHLLLLSSPVPW